MKHIMLIIKVTSIKINLKILKIHEVKKKKKTPKNQKVHTASETQSKEKNPTS